MTTSPLIYFRNVPATGVYLTSTVFPDDPTRTVLASAMIMEEFFQSIVERSSNIVMVGFCSFAPDFPNTPSCNVQDVSPPPPPGMRHVVFFGAYMAAQVLTDHVGNALPVAGSGCTLPEASSVLSR